MQEQQEIEDWRDEISDESSPTLKIADGEQVVFTFLDEGAKKTHIDYGTSIVFKVKKGEEELNWYVSGNNWDLRKQIKDLGTLTSLKAKVSRTGSKKSDTRYTIEKYQEN